MLNSIGVAELLPFLLSLGAAWFVIRLGRSKQGGVIPLAAGAAMAIFSYTRYSHYSSFLGQLASAFDNSITYLQYFWFGSLVIWLSVAAWGAVRLFAAGQAGAIGTAVLESIQTVTAPPTADAEVLTNDAVLKLVASSLGDDVIAEKIKYSRCDFALGSMDLVQLKQGGASDRIISTMLENQAKRGAARQSFTA
jgi:hypothetical protein